MTELESAGQNVPLLIAFVLVSTLLGLGVSYSGPGGGAASPGGASDIQDHGVFSLSLAGRKIGTETFDIRSSGDKIEARAEIQLRVEQGGKILELKTFPDLVMDSKFRPLTYAWTQKGSQSSGLEVDFRSSPVKCRYRTVTGQEDNRDFGLAKDVVVLDDNVLHHYELMVSRMGLAGGARLTLKAFIPQEALPGVLTVEEVGGESAEANGGAEKLRHLRVTTELARIDLWVDKQQHLQRVSNPQTQFEAVREK